EQLRHARDRGQAVLFSSHVLTEVEQVCDRVAILQRGRLVHMQAMRDMQARRVQVRFTREPDKWPETFGPHPAPGPNGHGAFDHSGEIHPLLEWLGRQAVDDVRIEPVGLAPVYHKYHGSVS